MSEVSNFEDSKVKPFEYPHPAGESPTEIQNSTDEWVKRMQTEKAKHAALIKSRQRTTPPGIGTQLTTIDRVQIPKDINQKKS